MRPDIHVTAERTRRDGIWDALHRAGGPIGMSPHVLRHLGCYAGQQGIFVDKPRTRHLNAGVGVTVSLLHKGIRYADDLAEDGVLYHYPQTRRPPGRDFAEVEATKAAHALRVPVFVIVQPPRSPTTRDVYRGWVEDWDDAAMIFLVGFGEAAAATSRDAWEEEPTFSLTELRNGGERTVLARPGQQRFKFRVIKRYGAQCAVCGVGVPEVLDAAHIRPKQDHGSDDPRNGLLLCALHHRAWDADLFGVHPDTLALHVRQGGPSAQALRISRTSLAHLPQPPHVTALEWRWRKWRQRSAADQIA